MLLIAQNVDVQQVTFDRIFDSGMIIIVWYVDIEMVCWYRIFANTCVNMGAVSQYRKGVLI